MKNQMFALIGLGLLLATASAYAQTGVVKANVPFNFIVNKTELPAGQYKILPMGITASAMAIQSPDGKVIKAFLPTACSVAAGTRQNQVGLSPLRYPVLPGRDLEGGRRPGTGIAGERA